MKPLPYRFALSFASLAFAALAAQAAVTSNAIVAMPQRSNVVASDSLFGITAGGYGVRIPLPMLTSGTNLTAGTVNSNALDTATRAMLGAGGTATAAEVPATFVFLGDNMQIADDLVNYYGTNYSYLTNTVNWILSNKTALNIVGVMVDGDIGDTPVFDGYYLRTNYLFGTTNVGYVGLTNEIRLGWLEASRLTNAGINVWVVPGNHDLHCTVSPSETNSWVPVNTNRTSEEWSTYFPEHFFSNQVFGDWGYGGCYRTNDGNVRNYWFTNVASRLGFIGLEWGPSTNCLGWAANVVTNLPAYSWMVLTHAYLNLDGSRITGGSASPQESSPLRKTLDGADGEGIYQNFLRHCPNIVAIFSGHVINQGPPAIYANEPITNKFETTDTGTRYLANLFNFQYMTNGGADWIQLARFDQPRQEISLRTLNTGTGEEWPRASRGAFEYSLLSPSTAILFAQALTNTTELADPATNTTGLANYDGLKFWVPFSEGTGTPEDVYNATFASGGLNAWVTGPISGYAGHFTSNNPSCSPLFFSKATLHQREYFSAALWVKCVGPRYDEPAYLMGIQNNSADGEFAIGLESYGQLRFLVSTTNALYVMSPISTGISNTWMHLAMTYDGSNFVAYRDGAALTNMAATGRVKNTAYALGIGGAWGSSYSKLGAEAYLSEAVFFDRALSAAEIEDLAAGAMPVVAESVGLSSITNAYWLTNWALLDPSTFSGTGLTNGSTVTNLNIVGGGGTIDSGAATNTELHVSGEGYFSGVVYSTGTKSSGYVRAGNLIATNYAWIQGETWATNGGAFGGDGAALTNLSADALATGTVSADRLPITASLAPWNFTNDFAFIALRTNGTTAAYGTGSPNTLTNYRTFFATANMATDPASGFITNLTAGWFDIGVHFHGAIAGGGDGYCTVMSNTVEVLRFYGYTSLARSFYDSAPLYLPANTAISVAAGGVANMVQQQLTVSRK